MSCKLKLWLWKLGIINKDNTCPFCKKPLMPHGFETLTKKQTWTCPDDECEFNGETEWHPSSRPETSVSGVQKTKGFREQGTRPESCRMMQ